MDYKDYYKTLGVPRSADAETIKKAYRKLARKYHPDVSKEADAQVRIKEVNEAWEVLGNADRRAAYDALGVRPQGDGNFRPPPGWGGQDPFGRGGPFAGGAGGAGAGAGGSASGGAAGGDFSDFFNTLFGRGRASARGAGAGAQGGFHMRGQDQHTEVRIDVEDSLNGTTRELSLRSPKIGPDGHVVMGNRSLSVTIPKGIKPGSSIRLAGQGGPGQGGGGPGDLFLEVSFNPHRLYRVDGADLRMKLPITPWEAALGATIEAPVPGGHVELTIPKGSTAGRTMRLRGRGLPANPPGDLYIELQVSTPPADSDEAEAFYRNMARTLPFDPRAKLT